MKVSASSVSKGWIVIGLLLVVLSIAGCSQATESGNETNGNNTEGGNFSQVCFGNDCFYVELAVTPDEKSLGLMFREHLDADKGMLFVYPSEGERHFWMKNTLIPLDMIWINSAGEVVSISRNVQPCNTEPCPIISPGKKVQYVLELNAGTSDRIGLITGDKITFDESIKDLVE